MYHSCCRYAVVHVFTSSRIWELTTFIKKKKKEKVKMEIFPSFASRKLKVYFNFYLYMLKMKRMWCGLVCQQNLKRKRQHKYFLAKIKLWVEFAKQHHLLCTNESMFSSSYYFFPLFSFFSVFFSFFVFLKKSIEFYCRVNLNNFC